MSMIIIKFEDILQLILIGIIVISIIGYSIYNYFKNKREEKKNSE